MLCAQAQPAVQAAGTPAASGASLQSAGLAAGGSGAGAQPTDVASANPASSFQVPLQPKVSYQGVYHLGITKALKGI